MVRAARWGVKPEASGIVAALRLQTASYIYHNNSAMFIGGFAHRNRQAGNFTGHMTNSHKARNGAAPYPPPKHRSSHETLAVQRHGTAARTDCGLRHLGGFRSLGRAKGGKFQAQIRQLCLTCVKQTSKGQGPCPLLHIGQQFLGLLQKAHCGICGQVDGKRSALPF